MALPASDSQATFDETTGLLNISPVLSAVLLKDTSTMGLIGFGEDCLKVNFLFNEKDINASFVTAAEASEITAAAVTFDLADASFIAIGAMLKDRAAGKNETLQVTNIVVNTLTVTRAFGGSAETHAKDAEFFITGQPKQQGDETITDISKPRTQVSNVVQNFKRTVKIADELIAEAANGMHPGISDEFQNQLEDRLSEMMVEYNLAIIHGIKSAAPSDTVLASMEGLIESIAAAGGNIQTGNRELTETVVDELWELAWEDGGSPHAILGHARQIGRFSELARGKVRVAPSDRVLGTFVTMYLTRQGAELALTIDRHMKVDEVLLLDVRGSAQDLGAKGIELCGFRGRTLQVEPLARIGNARRGMVTAGWSMRTRNATKAHAIARNLKTPPVPS